MGRLSSLIQVNSELFEYFCSFIVFPRSYSGISHAYGGVLSALSIHYTLSPIGHDHEMRWQETEIVSAIYHDRREVLARTEREVVGDFQHWEHEEHEVFY